MLIITVVQEENDAVYILQVTREDETERVADKLRQQQAELQWQHAELR